MELTQITRWVWPQTHRDPLASVSQMLGLKVCATTSWLTFNSLGWSKYTQYLKDAWLYSISFTLLKGGDWHGDDWNSRVVKQGGYILYMPSLTFVFQNKTQFKEWSGVKLERWLSVRSTSCSSRLQHPRGSSWPSIKGSDAPFWHADVHSAEHSYIKKMFSEK